MFAKKVEFFMEESVDIGERHKNIRVIRKMIKRQLNSGCVVNAVD